MYDLISILGQNNPILPAIQFVFQNWAFFIGVLLISKVCLFYWKRRAYPPGPRPLPFLGNLHDLAKVGGCFYRAAEMWRAEYGSIFTIWIGEKPWIFINSLEAILECNSSSLQSNFAGRSRTNTGDVQMQGNTGIIFSDYGPSQQAVRSVAQHALRKYFASCGSRRNLILSIVDDVAASNANFAVESKHIAESLVQAISTETMFGSQLDSVSQQELRDAHRDLEKHCPSGLPSDVIPIFKYLLWSREREGMKAFYRYNAIARDLCKRTAAAYFNRTPRTIGCVMDAVQSVATEQGGRIRREQEYLTPDNILQIVFDLFEAGSQTGVITLNWALLKCAADQELQQTLHEEIVTTVEALGHFPEKRDKRIFPRLQSFIREVFRYWPAAPFGLPRRLIRDTKIGPFTLPSQSTILFNLYSANRDASYWENSDVFDPTRFLNRNGNFDDKIHRGFVTFSLGPRACIGFTMALENMFFILGRILQNWQIVSKEKNLTFEPFPAALMLDAKIQKIELKRRL